MSEALYRLRLGAAEPWIVDACGTDRKLRHGEVSTLREDFVASLGDQIEPAGAAAPAYTAEDPFFGDEESR